MSNNLLLHYVTSHNTSRNPPSEFQDIESKVLSNLVNSVSLVSLTRAYRNCILENVVTSRCVTQIAPLESC